MGRIRQPHVQGPLRGPGRGTGEEQQADPCGHTLRQDSDPLIDAGELQGADMHQQQQQPQGEPGIAQAGDDRSLAGGRRGSGLFAPEADQQIGAESPSCPAGVEQRVIVGQHHHQRGEHQQIEQGKAARTLALAAQVHHRIKVDGQTDRRHHQ